MATNEQLMGLIKAGGSRQKAQTVYANNAEGERAAFILPDGPAPEEFTPDPDGANVNGANVARLIYQVRLPSDPAEAPLTNNSRVGAWMSTIWDKRTVTPTAKASHYSLYVLAKGFCEDPDFPQEVSAVVGKAETAAGVVHGKTETSIFVAEHELGYDDSAIDDAGLMTEDGLALEGEVGGAILAENATPLPVEGKLVVQQQVLVFRGQDVTWDKIPPDEETTGNPDDDASVPDPQDHYFGFGTAFNNAGPTPGYAAAIVKARKPELGGSPWHHAFFVKKSAVDAFSFRHQGQFGVSATGFDPAEDGTTIRAMPYMGLGLDVAEAPLHIQGPISLEQRFEYDGEAGDAYALGKLAFVGRSSAGGVTFGATPVEMAEIGVEVTDPAHNAEYAEIRVRTVQHGDYDERLVIGAGVYSPNAAGGDKGADTLNVKALYVDGFLAAGDDPDDAGSVTPVRVALKNGTPVVKATAPADARLRSVNVYRHAVTDDAAAAFAAGPVDNHACRSGKKIKWADDRDDVGDPLISGTDYYYYLATVTKKEVEGPLTLVGHVTYRGVQGPDIEANQIKLGTHVVTSGGTPVTDNDALNAKAHDPKSYNRNPTFQRWAGGTGSPPDDFTIGGSPTVSKATSSPRYGGWGLQVDCAAAAGQWLQTTASAQAELRVPPAADDHYVIEYEVTLAATTPLHPEDGFKRAGVWWKVQYQSGSDYKGFRLNLFDEHPSPVVGKTYSGAKVVTNDSGGGAPSGLPTDAQLYLMSNWALLSGGAESAKTLIWHRLSVRKATREEIRAAKGFDDNGDLARDLTSSRKVSSQIMTHATGGTYTGELNATLGAIVGSNLKDPNGTTLGMGEVHNASATFAARKRWAFKNSLQGFSLAGGTSALNPLWATITGNVANQMSLSQTGLSFVGADTYRVRCRLRPKQTITSGQWSGRCMWTTSGHGFVSASYRSSLPLPSNWAVDEWRTLEWNMSTPTVGSTDWTDSTITGILLDFTQVSGLAFDVAWIAIGDDGGDGAGLKGIADGATVGAVLGNGSPGNGNLTDSGGTPVTDNDALNAKAHANGGYNRNPTYQRWTGGSGSAPDNYAKNGGAAVTVSKQSSGNLYGAWNLRIANTSGNSGGVSATQLAGELRQSKDIDYLTFEWEVGLGAGGDFQRAGVIYRLYFGTLDGAGRSTTYKQFLLDFNVEHPSTTAGLYGDTKTVGVANTVGTPSGAPTGAELFLVNADTALTGSSSSAKTLDWHKVVVRKPTKEEVKTINLGALATKNTVGSADIDARSITPTIIGPRRLSGLVLDPSFADPGYWGLTNGGQIVSGTAETIAMGVANAFQANAATSTAVIVQAGASNNDPIPCEPNTTYSIKASTYVTTGFNGRCEVGISYYKYDGVTGSTIDGSDIVGGVDYTSSPAGGAVKAEFSATFTTPDDCDFVRVVPRVNWGANYPTGKAGKGLIGRLRISPSTPMNDGALLAAANVYTQTNDYAQPPRPTADNTVTLGTSSRRWSQLYAGTTTINTSDEREKTDIGAPPQEVVDVIAALPVQTFRYIDAVEMKGDGARWHYGFVAQAVAEAMAAAGHDPHAYGFYCEDALCEAVEATGEDGRPCIVETPVLDEQGQPVTRLGLRLDYLFAIRLEADARRMAALEARVSALEG